MRQRPSIPFLQDLLRLAMRKEAAALYVVPWMPPTLRIDDRSVPLSSVNFTPEQTAMLVLDLLDDLQRAALDRAREIQFSFVLDGVGRFRVHAFRRHGQPAMAIRPFVLDVPTPGQLALPTIACTAVMADRGLLVLSAKSASLRRDAAAALVRQRNQTGSGDLVLLDDASRYWHERVRCNVRQGLPLAAVEELLQRRAHRSGGSLSAGTPLAVLWGELRDAATLDRAVRAAERSLSIVTIGADGLGATLLQLLELAAQTGGADLRHRMAIHLHGVLVLRPVPAAAGGHDLAATDAAMNSPELAATLAEGDPRGLDDWLQAPRASTGADAHLRQLVRQGLVKPDDALRHAADRDRFSVLADDDPGSAPEPDRAVEPVNVDTGFADLFDPSTTSPPDAFDFADHLPAAATSADTQFDSVEWGADGPPSQPAELRSVPPLGGLRSPHSVRFHAWASPAVVPGQAVTVDLWAARVDQSTQVPDLARAAAEPTHEHTSAPAEGDAPELTMQLRIDGLLPVPLTRTLAWNGRPERARLRFDAPAHAKAGPHAARVRLLVGGLPLGELSFVLKVMPNASSNQPLEDTQAARRMLQSAYASYVPADAATVQACVQALQRVAPDLCVYLDAPQLRSGDRWRERIEREAGRRERLFLFWSAAAADSPWIDFEWRLMMRRRGPGVIDTVLLDPPRVAPLPAELSDAPLTVARPRPAGG